MNAVSKNFTLDEVMASKQAVKAKIDNTMPSIYYVNAINLANFILEPIRQHFGEPFSPSSWYRCEKLNKLVGGSATSDHMIGAAADIALKKVSILALAEYIRDNLTFDQVILEPGWVHVSYRKGANRMQVLRNSGKDANGKTIYLPGLE